MFKFGIAAALLTATATTGYVVARSNTEPAQSEPVAVSTGASTDRAAAPTAVPRNAITTTVAAGSTGATGSAASSDDPLGCANVSRHLAMVMAQTQSDLVEWLEQGHIADVERQMKPIADRYFEDCTKLEWSLAIRTCIGSIDDIVALQAKCEPPPTLPPERRTVTAPGETMIIDEEPRPAYTGSDHSCASVARHMLLLASPSKSMLARLPDDQREGIRDAMERMLHNLPETVEINCETTPWSLEDRRCILGSTTEAKAIECTRKKKTS